jgi:hypothetical protein
MIPNKKRIPFRTNVSPEKSYPAPARGVIRLINGVSNASNNAAASVIPAKIPNARVNTSGVPCSNN